MTRCMTSIPRTYRVEPSETYACKYCGRYVEIGSFYFHRCRTR
jgi:hypothetical protein